MIKVIKIKSLEEDNELFILTSSELPLGENIEIVLNRDRQRKTFEYLMDCMRDNLEVDKNKIFMELK